ncbi:hypothetical protein [Rhizobium sp. BK176]|uniref:hypothetical protein n=1 Tax=Rhizobium sp. BK176 TaxID=2587071 RepID=UPI00216AA1A1|nr:hypothetical protein [Rhizobium sp. BK176]MCS4090240.1 hypothetical protein [Rhizobium sp. BK176]
MKITVEVPIIGEVTSSKMHGAKWTVACERRDYEILEYPSSEAMKVLSYRLRANASPVDFHLVDKQTVRDTAQVMTSRDSIYRLEVGRNTKAVHPFFERAFKTMTPKLVELCKLNKASLKEEAMPTSFVDAISDATAPLHVPVALERGRSWWNEKVIEPQRAAFDAWMSRFLIVDDRLMVREEVPMLMIGGDSDYPTVEVVAGDDCSDPVAMNNSIGFMPKTFGYFGMEEFEAALDYAAAVGGGWLADQDLQVDMVSPLIPSRDYADMSVVDMAEGMRKRFVRRIASISHDPVENFAEMEQALASIDVGTFALFKELVDGIAEWNIGRSSARILRVVPSILADENARKVFFVTERLAQIGDLTLERWDAQTLDINALAA